MRYRIINLENQTGEQVPSRQVGAFNNAAHAISACRTLPHPAYVIDTLEDAVIFRLTKPIYTSGVAYWQHTSGM